MRIPEFNEIIEPNDQTVARKEHLEKLRELIGNVYPNKFERTKITGEEDTITRIVEFAKPIVEKHISSLAEGEKPPDEQREAVNAELNQHRVRVAGRLAVPPRLMGKAAFVHLSDGISRLQIYVRKQDVKAVNNNNGEIIEAENSGWDLFNLLDHGDFIGVEGFLFVTKTGELSVHVETIQFLSKAMLPMPDKMHGIADPEIRQRQRYADLIGSSLQVEHEGLTTREVFEIRAKVISSMRHFLEEHGYIEVETPMLTPKATGAAAKPFATHHKALDITLYARIAPELYLKRLVVGGFEKVYELNRNFRNEGISYKHNPEFTMLEFYCAYMDVNGMMDFCEDLLRYSVQKATGDLKVDYESRKVNFADFRRLTMKEAIVKFFPNELNEVLEDSIETDLQNNLRKIRSIVEASENYFRTILLRASNEVGMSTQLFLKYFNEAQKRENSLSEPTGEETAKHIEYLFETYVEKRLIQPTFIVDYPKIISPLSKASPENPQVAERFELFINGMECANGFSELNDPREQYDRFIEQMRERERGDEEAMVLDEDYIRALSYGMPPAAGIGIGIDRLVMLLTNRHSIRDVILFPHLRPERKDEEKRREGEEENGEA